jgi:hypothetical protein
MSAWRVALELDERRSPAAGNAADLTAAIRRGADLRVTTAFRHREHVDPSSANDELVREAMDFRVTYLIGDQWVAGIENLRMPVGLPDGFGPRPSMSFFLYNQDGNQALARLFLDGEPTPPERPGALSNSEQSLPRMKVIASADEGTNAPSLHFVYDFDRYRFIVRERWREVLSHDDRGEVISGSYDDLVTAVDRGHEVKLAIRGLCADLGAEPGADPDHEVFVHVGPCYEYTRSGFLVVASHPLVRVRPSMPMIYRSREWDFGWLVVRSDGLVARWLCDPYRLRYAKSTVRHAVRWFIDEA